MPLRRFGSVAVIALVVSPGLVAEEPSSEWLYMLPPIDLDRTLAPAPPEAAAHSARPPAAPVEALRPTPSVEIVMTPVGESIISCALVFVPDASAATPVALPLSEPVTVVFAPVEAPRPAR